MNRQDAAQSKIAIAKTIISWARHVVPLLAFFVLTSCAVIQAPIHVRIALFAPFEGRYQEVGYNALYAARLAIADTDNAHVDLLAVDDGGTEAASHAAALAQDPLVLAAVVLGYDSTSPETLKAFGDIPVIVAGDWGAKPLGDSVFILSNPQIDQQLTVSPRVSVTDAAEAPAPVIGGEVFTLQGFAKLRSSLDGVTVLSSGTLPDADFVQRYQASDQFAPTPSLLATLSYQATRLAAVVAQDGSRNAATDMLDGRKSLAGIEGSISFTNGYWDAAQIHRYHYVNGALTDDAVK